ncbi:mycofactocin-coupled SDR family oxidoreductase [soil metagenome]
MSGRLAGKVAFVTGAARSVGRSEAVLFAAEGADIIAMDIGAGFDSAEYPASTPDDLAETARLIEAEGRRVVTFRADVRDIDTMTAELSKAVATLGGLNIVSANAGIGSSVFPAQDMSEATWGEMIDINLTGQFHTAKAAIPHLIEAGEGGSIVFTCSISGEKGFAGLTNYVAAKHGVIGLMRSLAHELAPHMIRVNSVLPTQINTPMIMNDTSFKVFRPDLEHPTAADVAEATMTINLMPKPWIEPIDVAYAALYLVSDEARYVTGVSLPVDLGALTR